MKNGKKPTSRQREAIEWSGKDPTKWLVVKQLHDAGRLEIVHRDTGKVERVPYQAS